MQMQIAILLAFMLIQVVPSAMAPPVRWLELVLALGVYWLGAFALGAMDSTLARRDLHRFGLSRKGMRRHQLVRGLIQLWLLGGLAMLLSLGIGERLLQDLHLSVVPLVPTLLVFSAFAAALLLHWGAQYPFHREMRRSLSAEMILLGRSPLPYWSRREFILYSARHSLLLIAIPVCLILLCVESLHLYVAPWLPDTPLRHAAMLAGTLLCALSVFVLAPVLVVRIWKTRPLPPGPLRDQLEALCRQMHVRCRDIRIWESGGVLSNAAAMGVVAPARYLLITDALLREMEPEQIRAIFAHELGHIRCRHLPFAGLFALGSAVCSGAAAWAVLLLLGLWWDMQDLQAWAVADVVTLGILGVVWALGFGYISRRFERQSDVVGAWASGPGRPPQDPRDYSISPAGAEVFARSLRQVAMLNGMSLSQRNWRHGRMADRIEYILHLGQGGGSRREIDRTVRRIKLVLLLALLAGLTAMGLLAWADPAGAGI